jgi:hypothetical protein
VTFDHKKWRNKKRAERRAWGLCIHCGQPAPCERCAESVRAANRRYATKLRDRNKPCSACGGSRIGSSTGSRTALCKKCWSKVLGRTTQAARAMRTITSHGTVPKSEHGAVKRLTPEEIKALYPTAKVKP